MGQPGNTPSDAGIEMISIDVPADLLTKTFAVAFNPNCPSPWLVRMPGLRAFIDHKPYNGKVEEITDDALGFGKTLAQAATNAMDRQVKMKEAKKVK